MVEDPEPASPEPAEFRSEESSKRSLHACPTDHAHSGFGCGPESCIQGLPAWGSDCRRSFGLGCEKLMFHAQRLHLRKKRLRGRPALPGSPPKRLGVTLEVLKLGVALWSSNGAPLSLKHFCYGAEPLREFPEIGTLISYL